jgi:hypothetical protein
MEKIVNGYIIESEKGGYYYHRTRGWIKYDSPNKAFVWPEEDVKKILEASSKNPDDWELRPGALHPATFFSPVAGQVVINHPAIKVKDFGSSAIYKGAVISDRPRFNVVSNLVASDASL